MKQAKRSFVFAILVGQFLHSQAQTDGHLYGVVLPSGMFTSFELATGITTPIQQIPGPLDFLLSTTVDIDAGRFVVCTGTRLISIDPLGIEPMQEVTLAVPANGKFIKVQYNACDGAYYGLINAPNNIAFARYDPAQNAFTTLHALPSNMYFTIGKGGFLDPASQVYGWEDYDVIYGMSISPPGLLFEAPTGNGPGVTFGTIAFDPINAVMVGTYATPGGDGTTVKRLARWTPTEGVSVVNMSQYTPNYMKPMGGGSTVDRTTGTYYWCADGNAIIGANVSTGDMVYENYTSTGVNLTGITHMSGYPCGTTGIAEQQRELIAFPNPASDRTELPSTSFPQDILWTDMSGRTVQVAMRKQGERIEVDLTGLTPGLYQARSRAGETWRIMVVR